MPMLNFQPRFVEPIRKGLKAHTIRADRAIPIKAGDNLYLYCGARHPGCFRILPEPVVCIKAEPIRIWISVHSNADGQHVLTTVEVASEILSSDEMERLAIADGFENIEAFSHFWRLYHAGKTGQVDFKGRIIHWKPVVSHA